MNAVENQVRELVAVELASANERFPQFHSAHEGYAVIREELEETEEGVITEYPSEKAAAEALGVARSQISVACNTSWRCAGMKWYRKGEMPGE